jgi:hypothetical protein
MSLFVDHKTRPKEAIEYNEWKRQCQSCFGKRLNGCDVFVTKAFGSGGTMIQNKLISNS